MSKLILMAILLSITSAMAAILKSYDFAFLHQSFSILCLVLHCFIADKKTIIKET